MNSHNIFFSFINALKKKKCLFGIFAKIEVITTTTQWKCSYDCALFIFFFLGGNWFNDSLIPFTELLNWFLVTFVVFLIVIQNFFFCLFMRMSVQTKLSVFFENVCVSVTYSTEWISLLFQWNRIDSFKRKLYTRYELKS